MKRTSLRSGTFSKTLSSGESKEAAKRGRAAFFAPLTCTEPLRPRPPRILKTSTVRVDQNLVWIGKVVTSQKVLKENRRLPFSMEPRRALACRRNDCPGTSCRCFVRPCFFGSSIVTCFCFFGVPRSSACCDRDGCPQIPAFPHLPFASLPASLAWNFLCVFLRQACLRRPSASCSLRVPVLAPGFVGVSPSQEEVMHCSGHRSRPRP